MKRILIALALALAASALCAAAADDLQTNPVPALGQNAKDQKAFDPAKKGPRVLFVGNSITLHGPRPQIGWTNNWGMAASARDKDYVHLLQKKIAAVRPDAQCCLLQVAGTIERSFFKKDWSCERNFKWAREFKPDVIVLFFGANVPKDYDAGTMSPVPARTFGEALDAFRTYLDPEGKALVLFSQGFYIRPKLDAEKEAVAKKHGDVFVNMEDVRSRKDTHGRYNHPGDLGMELIAERFWQHIEPRVREVSVPCDGPVSVTEGCGNRWTSKPVALAPNRCYAFAFDAKGPATGTITAGSRRANMDLGAPGDGTRSYTNVFYTASASETFHFGAWHLVGTATCANPRILPVTPRYREFGGQPLGHGERVEGRRYTFATALSGAGRNHSRPLEVCNSHFNSSRWCLGRESEVVYRHELAGRTWKGGRVMVECGYWAGGSAAVEASADGKAWTALCTVTNATQMKADVPASLFPCKTLRVRFRGLAGCNLQIYGYTLEADFDGAPLQAFGATDYVLDGTDKVVARIKAPTYYDEGYGALVPGGTDAYDVWTASSGWKIPRTRGLPSERAAGVSLRTAQNEAEAVQLVVRPRRDVKDLRVTASIANIPVDVLRVGYVQVEFPTDAVGCRSLWPDPLPPQDGAFPVKAGENQPFWVRVKPPKGTPPGVYRGTLAVVADGVRSKVPFAVEVFAFELPDRMTCETAFGVGWGTVWGYHGLKTPEQRRIVAEKYLRVLSDHHLSPYDPSPCARWSVKWKDVKKNPLTASPEFDWTAWDAAMEKAFNEYHFTGFRMGLEGLGGGDWESRREPSFHGFAGGTPEYEALMAKYLGGVEAHLREKGWLDKAYIYWYDEPSPRDYDFVMNGFATLKRHAPALRRMLTEEPSEPLLNGPNTWCPLTPNLHASGEKAARALGDVFWWYVCCGPKAPYVTEFIDHPGSEMRLWLWQTWGENVQGVLIWTTTWWTSGSAYPDYPQNPYEDAMSWVSAGKMKRGEKRPWGNGDGRFLYPPLAAANGRPSAPVLDAPVDSYRLELLRDGIEDYEYFAMLKRLLAKKGASLPAADRARYEALLAVPKEVYTSMTEFATDPASMESHRVKLARAIETLVKR